MEAAVNSSSSSVRVFDGKTDFRVWRARVENELMRYHLLGYVMVRGYDGSQSFIFNGEQVPPRYPVVNVDDDSVVKEEASSCGRQLANQQGRLSRWDVLGESAEAKSILQRFLHPDVECAILNKNIYDSWKMLCALYGNHNNPGAHDVSEMHRVLHHIRLGDKKGEPVKEFITRWEMLMQQYALATGIELTDGFRSVSLIQTLPSAWRPMMTSWRGIRPFVPYPDLVERVIAERERMQMQPEATNAPNSSGVNAASTSVVNMQMNSFPEDRATEKSGSVKPVTQSMAQVTTDIAERHVSSKPVEKRAAEAPKATGKATNSSKENPLPIDVTTDANNTVDLTCGEVSTGTSSSAKENIHTKSQDAAKKSPTEQSDAADFNALRTSKSRKETYQREKSREGNDDYDKRDVYSKHNNYDTSRSYSKCRSSDRYAKSPRKSRSRYDSKSDSYDSNKNGLKSCFYCLKVGHHMKRCWYLKADIENGTTHDLHKKFSCAVTIDRNEFMVKCLESYIEEENRARASYNSSISTPRSHREYEGMESVGRIYKPQQNEFVHPDQPPVYGFPGDQQSASANTSRGDYRKRSHSVFQPADGRNLSQDLRLSRSRSVYRSSDVAEDFSPRKRARAPSCDRRYY